MSDNTSFDSIAFRNALGEFATGVAVITTTAEDGTPFGLTANSFASVSLEPPLVLWSLGKQSRTFDAFMQKRNFIIHILGEAQKELAGHFASRGDDKFADIQWQPGESGAPLLNGSSAYFECEVETTHDAGDHIIFIGRVIAMHHATAKPLVFHRGQFQLGE